MTVFNVTPPLIGLKSLTLTTPPMVVVLSLATFTISSKSYMKRKKKSNTYDEMLAAVRLTLIP